MEGRVTNLLQEESVLSSFVLPELLAPYSPTDFNTFFSSILTELDNNFFVSELNPIEKDESINI